jgi:HAD superfamily hydrolase (TIGR01484 family)
MGRAALPRSLTSGAAAPPCQAPLVTLTMTMSLPIRILSTDFDGTLHADFENPPIPIVLEKLIGSLQSRGVVWVINTGRDLSSLMETLGRARLSIWPDYVVTVEREIYRRDDSHYVSIEDWNLKCRLVHDQVFVQVKKDLNHLMEWVQSRFHATVYEDAYSPFCLIAKNNDDADIIHNFLNDYCRRVPDLTVVRNDIYARFSHSSYHKGSALAEIARRLGVSRDEIIAAGDHLNDLPMLSRDYARWLIAPSNAVPAVKESVRRQDGYISQLPHGYGLADGLETVMANPTAMKVPRNLPSS